MKFQMSEFEAVEAAHFERIKHVLRQWTVASGHLLILINNTPSQANMKLENVSVSFVHVGRHVGFLRLLPQRVYSCLTPSLPLTACR